MAKSRLYKLLSDLNELKWSVTLKGILCGGIAGLLAVLYRLGIEYGTETAMRIFAWLRLHLAFLPLWVAAAVGAGLLIAWLIRLEPMASGSGIPQVEGQLLYGLKMKWASIIAVRFGAGILSAFLGLSLGREGPTIQIGASGGQAVAKKIGKNRLEQNYLITGGAAAGLAAAFNAPLSGIMFALEEVHRSFSPLILIAATTAALTADVISKSFFGLKPVLNFAAIPVLPMNLYLWLLPLGLVSGLAGSLVNKSLLASRLLYKRLPVFLRPLAAILVALPFGLLLPQVLGGGQNLVRLSEEAKSGILLLAMLVGCKILFTCTSFGSGIPGGIFMPILSIGALSGSILGLVAVRFGMPAAYIPAFTVCAMAGALSGSVKAPITAILLTAEMSGSFSHLLPLAACSLIALLLSDLLKVTPIYEVLLERLVEGGKADSAHKKTENILEIPVEPGSPIADKLIRDIAWPQGALVVGIHRGNQEIVPGGDTQISSGDYLIILSTQSCYRDMSISLRALCHAK